MTWIMLSENDIRLNAKKFSEFWKDATSEEGEKQTFYNKFFAVFGLERLEFAKYELRAKKLNSVSGKGSIDVFWPGVMIVEHKSRGKDVDVAMDQADDYFVELPNKDLPRYKLACDFHDWFLVDVVEDKEYRFTLDELADNIQLFRFMWKENESPIPPSEPVDIKASEKIGYIYDALRKSGYSATDMEYLLTRLTFCMFAEDVGIFTKNQFTDYMTNGMEAGASEVGPKLLTLFEVLDTKIEDRQKDMSEELKSFPYVNGGLFEHQIRTPAFNLTSRKLLFEAAEYDWKDISPAIFGSLFQSVMNTEERRQSGAHYTAEENIMKVIQPLFLDDLNVEFEGIRGNVPALKRFHEKLSKLTFFDPACGAGNFLIITYREIRRLETKLIKELQGSQQVLDVRHLSKVDVDQFYGIEINKFSKTIAETAMWMMDHLMNNELSDQLGETYARIPIEKAPHIIQGDALELDWNDMLPPKECSYMLGNPPFGGSKTMTVFQRDQIKRIANIGKTGGTLDFVAGWFIKASQYADKSTRIGFVSTNSITQGEQVGQLWPIIKQHGMNIMFAHTTFKWDSEARGKAHVHVVIIGLSKQNKTTKKRLYHDKAETSPKHISPYLIGINTMLPLVKKSTKPINGFPAIKVGSQPIDGGHYIFTDEERDIFLSKELGAGPYIRRYVTGKDFLHGTVRWILYLSEIRPEILSKLSRVKEKVRLVKKFRLGCKRLSTIKLAETPTRYGLSVIPEKPFLVMPRISSERRQYVPIGYLESSNIPSDDLIVVENASSGLSGILMSKMHMVWLNKIGGKLKSDFRYSIGMVYNTFPVPDAHLDTLEPYVQKILDVRGTHPKATFADMYDVLAMPNNLRKAHKALDRAVDKLYRPKPFENDQERLEFLLERYAKMVAN